MFPDLPEIIDFHLHLCETAEHEAAEFTRPGWPIEWYWGNEARIVEHMNRWNVSHVVTLNLIDFRPVEASQRAEAERAGRSFDPSMLHQEMRQSSRSFNDWACSFHAREPRVIPFLFANPVIFGSELVHEVERYVQLGAKGVKLHPGIGGFFPDHPDLRDTFAFCSERQIPVLTDTGGRVYGGRQPGAPRHWAPILRDFPNLRLVIAHLPGELWDERIALAQMFGENLWFDLAGGFVDERHPRWSHRELPIEQGRRVLRKIGINRILFGSDGPGRGTQIEDCVAQVLQLGLTDHEVEAILSGNAKHYLALAQ